MRLLVLDEAWQAVGGVDTFRRFLLPALAARVEKLWWAQPALLHVRRLECLDLRNTEVLDTFPPTHSPAGWVAAGLRRLPRCWAPALRVRIQNALSRRHLRQLVRRLGITHLVEICVFRHPFPHFGIPVVGLVHDLDYPNRGHSPIDQVFRSWIEHSSLTFADSNQGRDELLELMPDAGARIRAFPSPPTPPPDPPPAREGNRWCRVEPVLYYPAAGIPRKNHAVLLAALAQLAARDIPFHCYLSGPGTDKLLGDQPLRDPAVEAARQACLRSRDRLRGRFTVLGEQPWAVVEEIFAAADIVVLPTRYEGFGLTLGEALRRGRPVVASRIPTFVDQVIQYEAENQVRWVPPDDADALAATLHGILTGAAPFPPFPAALQACLAQWTWGAFADCIIAALTTKSA
jgi:glycosyltransferase involved in cell wall biosynthesis